MAFSQLHHISVALIAVQLGITNADCEKMYSSWENALQPLVLFGHHNDDTGARANHNTLHKSECRV